MDELDAMGFRTENGGSLDYGNIFQKEFLIYSKNYNFQLLHASHPGYLKFEALKFTTVSTYI